MNTTPATKSNHATLNKSGPVAVADGTPSLEPIGDAMAQEGAKAASLARDWFARSAESCQHAVESARREAQAMNQRTQAYVREEPVKSVLIAAAAGAAITGLAMLMTRRR